MREEARRRRRRRRSRRRSEGEDCERKLYSLVSK
jgi:hypothetical protein